MLIQNNSKIVIIGDSISDFERARPVGEGLFEAIGKSYIALVDSFLKIAYPESGFRVVNMGTSGDTVRDIKRRWNTDVLDLKPDWVAVLIGNNDVWRQFDSSLMTETHVYLDEYEHTLESLVQETAPKLSGMILLTPFFMEPNRNDPMRAKMDEYGAAVKRIAERNHLICVDLQAAYDDYLRYYYSASISWDRVHPNPVGHMIIARAFLNAVGFDWGRMGQTPV